MTWTNVIQASDRRKQAKGSIEQHWKNIESFAKKQKCKYCKEPLTPGCWRMIHVKGKPLFFCNYQCQIHWTIKSKRVVIDNEPVDLVKSDRSLRKYESAP